jgi:hypothetical protein
MNCLRCGKETHGNACSHCGYAMRDGNSAVSLFELNIGEINAELQANRRAVVVCTACGAALPDGARFCPACGAAVSSPRAVAQDSVLFSRDASQSQANRVDDRNEPVNDKGGQDPGQSQWTEHNRWQSSIVSKIKDTISWIILSLGIALFVISIIISVFLWKEYTMFAILGPCAFLLLTVAIYFLIWSNDRSATAICCCSASSIINAFVFGIVYYISRGVSTGYMIGIMGAWMGFLLGGSLGWLFDSIITSERKRNTLGIITGIIIGIISGIFSGFMVP